MALCLSQLGLRAREVVQLLLDDIDWQARTLRIVRNKSSQTEPPWSTWRAINSQVSGEFVPDAMGSG
jgi:integrase